MAPKALLRATFGRRRNLGSRTSGRAATAWTTAAVVQNDHRREAVGALSELVTRPAGLAVRVCTPPLIVGPRRPPTQFSRRRSGGAL